MKGLIIFLAVCTLTATMVPTERLRKAVHKDASPNSARAKRQACEDQPCGWSMYMNGHTPPPLMNTNCTCEIETTCQITDEIRFGVMLLKCKPPATEPRAQVNF